MARISYGNEDTVNQALEEGWKLGVDHNMADGIITQDEETRLREFRDQLALGTDTADPDAMRHLGRASRDRLMLDARLAAIAVFNGGTHLESLAETLKQSTLYKDEQSMLLEHHLKELKLPSILREYGKMAAQCAAEGVDHPQYLLRLAELELIDRHQRMVERRIRAARFPAIKSLDTLDFPAIPSLNKALVMELARCEYIQRRENVIAVGNSGTGKTHVALGLGLAACQRGLSVGFTTAAALVHEMMEARDERRLLNLQKQLARLNLLIIDELGFVPLSRTGIDTSTLHLGQVSSPGLSTVRARVPDGPTSRGPALGVDLLAAV